MAVSAERETFHVRPIDVPNLEVAAIPPEVYRLHDYVINTAIPRGDLRRGQVEALLSTVDHFTTGGRVGFVEQASGYGKSRFMEEVGKGLGGKQLYITPGKTGSQNIASQLGSKFDVGRVDSEHQQFDHDITIITMQSLNRLFGRVAERDPNAIIKARKLLQSGIIFPDEVHHYLTPKALENLSVFLQFNPKSLMLGATATEGYDDSKNSSTQFGKLLHRVDLSEAVDEGVLISPHLSIVKTGLSLDDQPMNVQGDYLFNTRIPRDKRDKVALRRYQEISEKEGRALRVLSYLTSVEHAENFAAIANQMEIPTEVIIGRTNNRSAAYERLRRREIANIATVGTAIESLDLPWLEGIVDLAPTRSVRVARQKFPRPMRNIPGKKPPWIIQVIDERTTQRFRPIVASEVFNVRRFDNDGIVVPRRKNEELYDHRLLQLERGSSNGTSRLEESAEVNIESEVIDIDSLFNISLLDRVKLLREGLLDPESSEALRCQILDQIHNRFQSGRIILSKGALETIVIPDGAGKRVPFRQIVSEVLGLRKSEYLKQNHYQEAINLLGLTFEDEQTTDATYKGSFIDSEFKVLCDKFREGTITSEEVEMLALFLRKTVEAAQQNGLRLDVSRAYFEIKSPAFNGTLRRLGILLGINNEKGVYVAQSRDVLLGLINSHSEGNQIVFVPLERAIPKGDQKQERQPKIRRVKTPSLEKRILRRSPNSPSSFQRTLYEGRAVDVLHTTRKSQIFFELCQKYRNGMATEQDLRALSSELRSIFEHNMAIGLGLSAVALSAFQIDPSLFRGSFDALSKTLGFGSLNAANRNRFLEIINTYSEGPSIEFLSNINKRPVKTHSYWGR